MFLSTKAGHKGETMEESGLAGLRMRTKITVAD